VRLNNSSQLAGFAKANFLCRLIGAEYRHEPMLAPTQELLDAFKKHKGDWSTYERDFLELMNKRQIESRLVSTDFETPTALLCSEATPESCHRRLVCEYLAARWPDVQSIHL
jgi:uncharacterized protein YeaO (DUF488 family)